MKDKELHSILLGAGQVPECPSDKFVDAFLAQMDADLGHKAISPPRSKFIYGSIAAATILAIFGGFGLTQLSGPSNVLKVFDSAKVQNVANTNIDDSDIIAVLDTEVAEDEFVAELVGAEDISTIVPMVEN